MQAYVVFESSDDMKNNSSKPDNITHHMIEKMKKVISSHRAASDFDRGFLNKMITADGYDFVAEVKSERVSLVKIEK